MLICLLAVVGAMIEFAILMFMRRKSEHKVLTEMANTQKYECNLKNWQRNITTWNETLVVGKLTESVMNFDKPASPLDEIITKEKRKFLCESNRIDYIALCVFAFTFLNFNIVYWVYYLLC